MTDANEVEFGNQASKVRLQDEVGKIKNRQGEACIEVIDNQNVGMGTDSPDRKLEILDASNPQLRLTHTDNTEHVEFQALADGNGVIQMTGTAANTLHIRSDGINSGIQLQNTSTGTSDGYAYDGFQISASQKVGYIWFRNATSQIKIGTANTEAISIDATQNTTAVANLTANGNATLGDASDDTHTLNGTLQFAQEVVAPSAPGSGDGGIFYVKTDGIPYYISNSTAETSLVGGGGGGLTVTAVATGDSPVTGAVDTVYIVNSSGGNVEIDLPAVSGNSGKTIDVLHKTTGNDCIIDPNASETINGSSTSITLAGVAYQNVTLICDGTEWYIR
jgi:hypothetical protein